MILEVAVGNAFCRGRDGFRVVGGGILSIIILSTFVDRVICVCEESPAERSSTVVHPFSVRTRTMGHCSDVVVVVVVCLGGKKCHGCRPPPATIHQGGVT
jgi:hypothetical protein